MSSQNSHRVCRTDRRIDRRGIRVASVSASRMLRYGPIDFTVGLIDIELCVKFDFRDVSYVKCN
jgi:hypothetical protein